MYYDVNVMNILRTVLAELIRSGKVTVEIPNLDMEQLKAYLYNESRQTLQDISYLVYEEELTDAAKIKCIRERLEHNTSMYPTAKPTVP